MKPLEQVIEEKAREDGQFAIAWALIQVRDEIGHLRRGLVGDYRGPGVLNDREAGK